MAYFHVNDPYRTPITHLCTLNDVYLSGLQKNQVLLHLEPAFMQKDNGLMVGVDQRFTNFYIVDQDHLIVDRLNIEWKDCIKSSTEATFTADSKNDIRLPIYFLSIVFLLIIMIMMKRVARCKRY